MPQKFPESDQARRIYLQKPKLLFYSDGAAWQRFEVVVESYSL